MDLRYIVVTSDLKNIDLRYNCTGFFVIGSLNTTPTHLRTLVPCVRMINGSLGKEVSAVVPFQTRRLDLYRHPVA